MKARLAVVGLAAVVVVLGWLASFHTVHSFGLDAAMQPDKPSFRMNQEQASGFARLALKGIRKEYPNKPDHVLNETADLRSPRALHPAFYGCFDWHSSVHGHWMLVRLLRLFPELPQRQEIRTLLAEHLTEKNLQTEAAYFGQPN